MAQLQGGTRDARALAAYFALAYAVTWGGIFAYLTTLGFDFERIGMSEGLVIFGLMLLGPATAGLVLTAATDGATGLARLIGQWRRWQAPMSVWAAALLTNPLTLLFVLVALAYSVGPEYAPGFAPVGLVIGLIAGSFEELGWTGFATPRLLVRLPTLRAGLLLGVLWAVWHGPADFAGNIAVLSLPQWILRFAAYWLVPLTAYRVLMTWIYARSRSLLIGVLAHASYTGWQFTFSPPVSLPLRPATAALLWYVVFALALTLVVAVIVSRGSRGEENGAADGQQY